MHIPSVSHLHNSEIGSQPDNISSSQKPENDEANVWEMSLQAFTGIQCPFEKKMNPHVKAIYEDLKEWAEKYEIPLCEKNLFAQLMGGAHPYCSREKLTIFVSWVTMLFEYDDKVEKVLCKDPEGLKEFNIMNLHILRGESIANAEDDPLTRAMCNLRLQLDSISTPAWMARFIKDVEEHLHAIEWESTKQSIPTLDLYLKMRPFTAAVYAMFDLCELAEGVQISDSIFESEYFKELRLLCNNIIWIFNDIISFHKEAKGTGNNIIHIFMEKERLDFAESLIRTQQFCTTELVKLQNLLKNVPDNFSQQEKKYVEGLKFWIASNYHWSLGTLRYKTRQFSNVSHSWQKV
jgi:hypothetical protein